jgi:hypothetical protein
MQRDLKENPRQVRRNQIIIHAAYLLNMKALSCCEASSNKERAQFVAYLLCKLSHLRMHYMLRGCVNNRISMVTWNIVLKQLFSVELLSGKVFIAF